MWFYPSRPFPFMTKSPRTGRPNNKGVGRQSSTGKRAKFTIADKVHIVRYFDTHGTDVTRQRCYNSLNNKGWKSQLTNIYRWRSKIDDLEARAKNPVKARSMKARPLGVGTAIPREFEVNIAKWVVDMRNHGVPVGRALLCIHALECFNDMQLPNFIFKASYPWVRAFLGRHGLAMRARTRQGQESTEAGQLARAAFGRDVRERMKAEGITDLFNADQTGVLYEYLPTTTISVKGAKTVWVRCGSKTKDRITAMLLASSDGSKRPLFVVLKTTKATCASVEDENRSLRQGFSRRTWPTIQGLQAKYGCRIYGNPTAWWNESISLAFLDYQFGARPNMATKVLLVWDAFSAHSTAAVLSKARSLGVVLMEVPKK